MKSTKASPFVTRLAGPLDAEKITQLINVAFRGPEAIFIDEDRIDLATVLASLKTGEFLVAEENSEMRGCVYLEQRVDRTYLGLLSVAPAFQGSGLGSLLMTAAEERCRSRNSRFIDILIINVREELPAFYKKRGFLETGTSPFPSGIPTKIPVHFINMSKRL